MKILLLQYIPIMRNIPTWAILLGIHSALLCFSNFANSQTDIDTINATSIPMPLPSSLTFSQPYQVAFQVSKIDKDDYMLDFEVNLDKGYYVTSVLAYDMKGRFKMKIGKNDYFVIDGEITETPPAMVDRFPWSSRTVKINRNKTNYKQKIKLSTNEDFEVPISISFVIEPRCTMEHLNFTISNRSGKLIAKRM